MTRLRSYRIVFVIRQQFFHVPSTASHQQNVLHKLHVLFESFAPNGKKGMSRKDYIMTEYSEVFPPKLRMIQYSP